MTAIPYTQKGEIAMIPDVRREFCPICGESVLAAGTATVCQCCWLGTPTATSRSTNSESAPRTARHGMEPSKVANRPRL